MGSFGNIAIAVALPMMGGIYDSYTVANLPPQIQTAKVTTFDGKDIPLIVTEQEANWVPAAIAVHIYPAGDRKLNPDARKLLDDVQTILMQYREGKLGNTPEDQKRLETARIVEKQVDIAEVEKAEAIGAAYAFRWVAVLPCILVFIFGAIAVTDRLRGGYKAVHIGEKTIAEKEPEATPL